MAGYFKHAAILIGLALALTGSCRAGQHELLAALKAKVTADASDFVTWNKLADAELSQLSATGDPACLTRRNPPATGTHRQSLLQQPFTSTAEQPACGSAPL